MNFLKDNIIFVFGALSLISIVFAASGIARTNIGPLSTSAKTEPKPATPPVVKQTEPKIAPAQSPTVSTVKPQTHYQISGVHSDDGGFEQKGFDD